VGQIKEKFLITYKVQTELIRMLSAIYQTELMISATTLPNLKKM
jgi:hypothetical protein